MAKKIKVESRTELTITIKHRSNSSIQVEVMGEPDFADIMWAAEYLLWTVSDIGGYPIDEAAMKLAEEAKTYHTAVIPISEGRM